jgi:cytochrome c-type biogenesis protein CcmE
LKKSKFLIITGLLAIFIVLMMGIFTENISPYISVSDLKTDNTQNKNVQLYGQVILDTIFFNDDSGITTFDITDGNQSISVTHKGMINNLEHSTEVVAIGEYNNGLFQAEKVLVKCPSKYEDLVSEDD